MPQDILVVDDEADIRTLMCGILADEGYDTRQAGNSDGALAAIRSRQPSLVVLDIWLQGSELDGLEILKIVKRELPQLAGSDDLRSRQHRNRRRGDQARRL